jgi:hypothetical protein
MPVYTTTTSSFELEPLGSTITIPVVSSAAFVINDSVLVSCTGTIFVLLVMSMDATDLTGMITQIIAGTAYTAIPIGSDVVVANAFTGPQGSGVTTTTSTTQIYPVGTKILVNVADVTAFPVFTYVLISDGVYSLTGQVVSQGLNTLSVRILTTQNAVAGSTLALGAVVTFSGPVGPPGATQVGDQGTTLFYDLLITPANQFNTQSGPIVSSVLGIINFSLPGGLNNGLSPNYRIVAELVGTMATNQALTFSNIGYFGIGCATQGVQTSALFSGYTSGNYGAANFPIISNSQCVADTSVVIANPSTGGYPAITRFIGTFGSNSALSFSVLGAGTQPNVTLNPSASLTITCYPLYQV